MSSLVPLVCRAVAPLAAVMIFCLTASSAPLVCDVPLDDAIATPAEVDTHTFSVSSGEVVAVTVDELSTTSGSFNLEWRILTDDGFPAGECGTFSVSDTRDCTLPTTGNPYRIEVRDNAQNGTGTYAIHLQRLTAAQACEDLPVTCDVPLAASFPDGIDSDLMSFSVTDGEIVSISVDELDAQPFSVSWRVLDASGSPAPDCGSYTGNAWADCGPLPASGNPYRIHVRESDLDPTGQYEVNVQRVTIAAACDRVLLPCDVPLQTTIDHELDTDLFGFDVAEGEVVAISVDELSTAGGFFNAEWRVLAEDGSPAPECGVFSVADTRDCQLPAGSYSVEVRDNAQNGTGTYAIHLQRLTEAQKCEDVPVMCDVPLPGTLADGIDNDLMSFSVTDGEIVSISVDEVDAPPFTVSWRVLDASGSPAPDCGSYSGNSWSDCGPLPASGNPYRIQVRESDLDPPGQYEVNVQRVTMAAACDRVLVSCDEPLQATIDHELDTDLFGFDAAEGEVVAISVDELSTAGGSFNAEWRVLAEDGSPAPECGVFSVADTRDCQLPAGSYSVEVRDNAQNGTGTYAIHLQRLTAAEACEDLPVTCDVPLAASFPDGIDSDLMSFSVTDGEIVSISVDEVDAPPFTVSWRVLDASGSPAPDCGSYSGNSWSDCGPLPASGNPYRIQVRESDLDPPGTYEVHLQRLPTAVVCDDSMLTCDVPVETTIDHELDTDLFGFDAAEGEVVAISVDELSTAGGSFNAEWRVLAEDGSPAPECGVFSVADTRDCQLPAGSYSVEVRDNALNGTGTYGIHLQRLTFAQACEDTTLACDDPLTGTLESGIDSDLSIFDVDDGEIVSISVEELDAPPFTVSWRVLDASGSPAPDCGAYTGNAWADCGPLPASGSPYCVQVRESDLDPAGGYTLYLQRLAATSACDNPYILCDGPLAGEIEAAVETDLHRFNIANGDSVTITVSETSTTAGSFNVEWRLLQWDGAPASDCGSFSVADVRECGPFFGVGNPFRIEIRDNARNGTGTYTVELEGCTILDAGDPSAAPAVTRLLTTAPNPFNPTTHVRFDLATPADVELALFDVTGRPVRRLVERDGLVAGSYVLTWDGRDDAGRPVASGTYFLRLLADGRRIGSAQRLVLLK